VCFIYLKGAKKSHATMNNSQNVPGGLTPCSTLGAGRGDRRGYKRGNGERKESMSMVGG